MEIKDNKKKRLFVEAYDEENPVIAMRVAGFQGTDSYLKNKAKELVADPHIQKAIEERNRYLEGTQKVIATRAERQAFWTAILRNDASKLNIEPEYDSAGLPKPVGNIPLAQRIKASELLGKSETDFVDRVDINHNVTITEIIQQSYLPDDTPIEVIEAQYEKLADKADKKEEEPPLLESFI